MPPTKRIRIHRGGIRSSEDRNRLASKGSTLQSKPQNTRLLLPTVVYKKDEGHRPIINLEQICLSTTHQDDGKNKHASRCPQEGELYHQGRPEGCIFPVTNFRETQELDGICKPPVESDRQSPSSSKDPESSNDNGDPSLEGTALVPSTPEHDCQDSSPPAMEGGPLSTDARVQPAGHSPATSLVDYLRE